MRIDPIALEAQWAGPISPALDVFAPFRDASPDRPFVVGQLGQSLDGRIATLTGESRDISGDSALTHLHRIRAHVDAVVVGAGTIVADDPRLSVRRVKGRNPARVVIEGSTRRANGWRRTARAAFSSRERASRPAGPRRSFASRRGAGSSRPPPSWRRCLREA